MRIVEQSDARLVLGEFPWEFAAWFLPLAAFLLAFGLWLTQVHLPTGLLLASFGLAIALALSLVVRRIRVIFERATGEVRIETRSLWRRRIRAIPLADIRAAVVQSSALRDRHTRVRLKDGRVVEDPFSFRPALALVEEEHPLPLTLLYTRADDTEAKTIVAAINTWLGRDG
jgi:hypothetical protein